jgi:hypothetical protein
VFARYVLEVYWYTFLSTDTAAMAALAPDSGTCRPCQGMIDQAEDQQASNAVRRWKNGEAQIRDGVAVQDRDNEYTARWDVQLPRRSVLLDRDTAEEITEEINALGWHRFLVTMRWQEDHWELVTWTVPDPE